MRYRSYKRFSLAFHTRLMYGQIIVRPSRGMNLTEKGYRLAIDLSNLVKGNLNSELGALDAG